MARSGLAVQLREAVEIERELAKAQRRAERAHVRIARQRRIWRGATEYEDKSVDVKPGRFFGLYIGSAVYMYLVEASLPQSAEQIRKALARGGFSTRQTYGKHVHWTKNDAQHFADAINHGIQNLKYRGIIRRVDALSWYLCTRPLGGVPRRALRRP